MRLHKILMVGMCIVGMMVFAPGLSVHAAPADQMLMSSLAGINLEPAFGDLLGESPDEADLLAAGRAALEEMENESEYAKLAIAHVDPYVNVRSLPSTDGKVLGKIYNGAVAHIIEAAGENDEWLHVTSGSVEGYIKAEYFFYGKDAVAVIEDYVTRYAKVTASRLNVRKEASTEAGRIGYLNNGEKIKIKENLGEWLKVEYSGQTGYVSAEYTEIIEEFSYAISIEEEQAEKARLKALEERKKQQEAAAPENTQTVKTVAPAGDYSTNSELRESLVAYAKQFIGNPYVNGGNSLTNGTDCSGFTKLIYGEYGYSLGRTPGSQLSSAGRSIDYSEVQIGDILCYSSNGGKSCTHVAIYIGDGMIVHAANSKKGICTQKAEYSPIMAVKNVID